MLKPGGNISSVRREAAVGTITLQFILFLRPSIEIVLHKPTKPNFAALYNKNKIKYCL